MENFGVYNSKVYLTFQEYFFSFNSGHTRIFHTNGLSALTNINYIENINENKILEVKSNRWKKLHVQTFKTNDRLTL